MKHREELAARTRANQRREAFMVLHKKGVLGFAFVSAALVFSVLTFARSSDARPRHAEQTKEQISVAGHLDLEGMPVKQMFLQQRDGLSFLFLRRADQNAFAIVDVTDPSSPRFAGTSALREPAGGSVELPTPGSALAIAFVPEQSSAPAASRTVGSDAGHITETVQLIDLSDPSHPQTMKVFNRVTSMASDDGRSLVFLVNDEGLWIVSHHLNRPLPACTSESAMEPLPDCQ